MFLSYVGVSKQFSGDVVVDQIDAWQLSVLGFTQLTEFEKDGRSFNNHCDRNESRALSERYRGGQRHVRNEALRLGRLGRRLPPKA